MSVGAILVGIGALLVVVSYIVRPFRTATRSGHIDRVIEAWVARVRGEEKTNGRAGTRGEHLGSVDAEAAPINFCPQCGRRVMADDRFCSGCGTRLGGGSA
jgi:hypothetical protein